MSSERAIKVLIADDEPLVRLAVRDLLSRGGFSIGAFSEAANGSEALRLIRQPDNHFDLMILDIQMPVMNGIELLKELRRMPGERPLPVTLVLSAYADYPYVREAFLLGALDYIVKVDLDEEHVYPVIQNALEHIRRHQSDRGLDREQDGWEERSLAAAGQNRRAVDILPDPVRSASIEPSIVEHGIRQMLERMEIQGELLRFENTEYVVLPDFKATRSHLQVHHQLRQLANNLHHRFRQYMNLPISVGISGPAGERTWQELRLEARRLAEYRFYYGYGKTFDAPVTPATDEKRAAREAEFRRLWREVAEALACHAPSRWQEAYRKWCDLELGPDIPAAQTRAWFTDALWDLGIVMHRFEGSWEELDGACRRPFELLQQCETVEKIRLQFRELLDQVHARVHKRVASPHGGGTALRQAKALIDQYYHEGITLTWVSEMIGVSESHLSKVFVRETGEKFIDYLTRVRIKKAIQLFASEMRMYEIAERVGYSNAEHFSRVFKKMTGMSPVQYRDRMLSRPLTES